MNRLGLDFRFWDATRPDDVSVHEMATRSSQWARPLRPTEVACLLSHRSAWKVATSGTSPTLILEDDAVLSDATPKVLPQLAHLAGVDLVNLETFRAQKRLGKSPSHVINGYGAVFPLYRDRGGAACYLLWPSGAAKLLAYTDSFSPLADAAINLAPGLRREQIVPALAVQEMHLFRRQANVEDGIVSAGPRPRSHSLGGWLWGRSIRLYTSLRIAAMVGRHAFSSASRDIPFAND